MPTAFQSFYGLRRSMPEAFLSFSLLVLSLSKYAVSMADAVSRLGGLTVLLSNSLTDWWSLLSARQIFC